MTSGPHQDAPHRILFVIDNLRPGGAQKALLALVDAVRRTRLEPIVWRLGGTSGIEEAFRERSVSVLGGSENVLRAMMQPISLTRCIRRRNVKLVQTFLFHSDITGRLAARTSGFLGRRPAVISSVRATNRRNRWWQFALQRLTARLSDAVTAVSERTLDFAVEREGVRRDRAIVIPNGIALPPWNDPPTPTEARRKLGIEIEVPTFGSVGRLHEQKGQEYLLEAMARIAARRPDAQLVIAGYGPLEDRLKAVAEKLKIAANVHFLGYREDVRTVLAALDVFVLPSLWEGMSNALLEAMAAGKPVVATSVDGNVEQVLDGETGLLVPPKDVDALAEALGKLLDDPAMAAEMGRRGRERATNDFDLDKMTQAHLALYERLLKDITGVAPGEWR